MGCLQSQPQDQQPANAQPAEAAAQPCEACTPGSLSMGEEAKELIRGSWTAFVDDANVSANSCYILFKFFELCPEAVPLFTCVEGTTEEEVAANEGMQALSQKFCDAISKLVNNLDHAVIIKDELQQLGAKHVAYGAKEEHVPHMIQGILAALEKALGENFTPAHKEAWSVVLAVLGQLMIEGLKAGKADTVEDSMM